MCSSPTLLTKIYIVRKPFKNGGEYYPVGSVITDPTGIRLFKLKVNDDKVMTVTEQNLDRVIHFFKERFALDVENDLKEGLSKEPADTSASDAEEAAKKQAEDEYLAKVTKFAEQYGVSMEGREIAEVVAEIKAKQAEAKAVKE